MSEKIPKGWKWVKLGEAPLKIIDGDRGKNYPSNNDLKKNGYCLFLSTKNVKSDGFCFDECQFITKEKDEALKKGKLKRFDLVFTTRGTVGNVGYFNSKVKYENIRINSGMVIIRPDTRSLNPEFNYYIFRFIGKCINSFVSGSAQPQLPIRDLKEVKILLPPLPEQKVIAEVLSSIDDKIELLHRQNKTLEEMAMTLFRQWFIEPTKDGLPEGWEEVEIGDILKETIGGDWGENEKFEGSISVFCLRGIDLDNIKIYGHSNSVPIRYVSKDSLEKRTLTENQILLAGSGIGPIGKTLPIHRKMINSFNLPVIYSNFCKRLEAKNKEIAYYMEFFIFYMYKNGELDQFHSGTSIPNFNMKNFLKLKIYFPPIIDIIKFSNFLDMFYSKKFSPQIQTLEKLRDTLLPKLMIGEVRIMKNEY